MSAPNRIDTTYIMPLDELIELLETTRPDDAPPVRFRVKPDRRTRREPPPEPDRRQQ